ncbi:MAG: DEAD/DEAH box helicase [Clostridiales bacterium]|nr:DEAD/DEAH box helicase [Clostridiales bacterium]
MEAQPPWSYLAQMAMGLGKTVTFANIPRHGRMLILSHRQELVYQPLKYFDCETGVEMAGEHAPESAQVVSASVAAMVHRLNRFDPEEFDLIICDEAHHAAARTYKTIFAYFQPRKLIGFTATPNRGDNVRLNDVFSDIIFQRDLRWAIQEGWLCDIYCRRVNIGYDLSAVHTRNGDYAPGELEEAMDGTADAIAEAYRTMAQGATLIFAVSVKQCHEIASRIPGAEVVTGETKHREDIIRRFTDREIQRLINCMVFTEGTDLPLVETVIIARPTQSDALYAQMVGRGLRLYPGKTQLNLIDCVGVTGKASLCTAPSLLGIDMTAVPAKRQELVEGMLFELPDRAAMAQDTPESWIRNVELVDLWAKGQKYNTHNVNWFRMPDGSMVCSLPNRRRMTIPPADHLGRVRLGGEWMDMQSALDRAYTKLQADYMDCDYLWNLTKMKRWQNKPASEAQKRSIRRMLPGYDASELTKGDASMILNRMFNGGRRPHDRSARAKSHL